jgi:LysR family hydrogen peroxide-inducible transcriptional activator
MAITLRQLRYFTALAEARHFGRAADLCHVSQPALSVQIRELEAALGLVLIDRQPRDAVLTRAGREVLRRAQRVLDEVAGLEAAAQRETGLTAPLHLGLIPTVAPYLLPGVLARLRAGDITMDIRVREAQTSALLADLADGTLDAAVVALPGPAGLNERLLFEDRFLLAGSAAGLAAGEGGESIARLRPVRGIKHRLRTAHRHRYSENQNLLHMLFSLQCFRFQFSPRFRASAHGVCGSSRTDRMTASP